MKYPIIALVITFLVSCNLDSDSNCKSNFFEENKQEITKFIADNDLENVQKSSSGLHYIIENEGTGEHPTITSNVTVVYKGYYTNGVVFDQSSADGISINLQEVIKGWTEGISLFKEGGNGILLIPSHLGYGNCDHNTISGGSVLIFDVSLISVN